MEHLPFWDFRPYQAIGAVLFGRADFKIAAGRFYEDALWLLGPEGLDRFAAIDTERAVVRPPSDALRASGYYILRSDRTPAGDYVCFDCGEQAAGMRTDAIPNSMHGHADALSVTAWLGGRAVLVDSGFYAYNAGGAWEAHFRETAAHNTARVDGRDQARHIGKMAWSHSYRTHLDHWDPDGPSLSVAGHHDGYARGEQGVTHRRTVVLRPHGYLAIQDEFAGSGEHDFEINYHFAPGTLAIAGDGHALFEETIDVIWCSSSDWTAETATGGDGPEDGWIAESLGVLRAAPRLRLRTRASGPRVTLVTVLSARLQHDTPRIALVRQPDGTRLVSAMSATGEGTIDWITPDGPLPGTREPRGVVR